MSNQRFTMFVPHGAPTFALNPGVIGQAMAQSAQQFLEPRAIVIVSPHWATQQVMVGTGSHLPTIHDFYGFDQALYALNYPAIGCPEAAQQVLNALKDAGISASASETQGLDHGAWIPLRQMFPDADVPVIPVSVQPHLGPAHAWQVGRALAPLVKEGFFVIGSGNITHNLGDWQHAVATHSGTPSYVQRYSDWIAEKLQAGDTDALLNYRSLCADGVRAHPTDEHLLPLFTALGAAGPNAKAKPFFRGVSDIVIAMDGYVFE